MSRPAAKISRRKRPEIPSGSVLQLKIMLLDVHPTVWRRVAVSAACSLQELHGVIQVAMGWRSYHLYQFHLRAVRYGSWELAATSPAVALEALRLREGGRLRYDYDMTSGWRHAIRIEAILPLDPVQPAAEQRVLPVCLDGKGGCPPEDCGGPEDYAAQRDEASGLDALDDLAASAEFAGAVVGTDTVPALDEEARWELEQLLERIKARRPFLDNDFSAAAVNDRFRAGDHHILMHQQVW